jgi:hypothetical protein
VDAVRVTEGELKAYLAALRTGVPTIACPGVGLFGGNQVLDWILDLGASRVILSPDSDHRSNHHVSRAVSNAITRLGAVPYPITVETWEPTAKGIDDALQAGLAIQEISPEEFKHMLEPSEQLATTRGFAVVGDVGEDQWAANPISYPEPEATAPVVDEWEEDPEALDDMPPTVPFPVDVLPEPIRRFVLARAEELQTPIDMQAVTLLGAASVPLLRSIEMNPYGSWVEPIGILAAPVAVPSELKSATHRAIFKPHEHEQARQKAMVEEENSRRKAAKRVLLMEISQAKKDQDHDRLSSLMEQAEELELKTIPNVLIDDATEEAKAQVMSQNQGRIGVSSPEGSLFANVAKYSNDGSVSVDTVIKAHAGDPIRVHRIGRLAIDIPKTGIGGTIMPQPEILDSLGKHRSLKGIGFLARWVWSVPKSKVGERNMNPEICPAFLYGEWDRICSRMFTLGADPENPQVFTFTPQAVTRLREFRGEIEPQLAGDLAYMSDWAGKLAGLCVRLSGILHILEHYSSGVTTELPSAVKLDTLERAICVGRYALAHAKRAYYLMGFRPDQQGPRDVFAVLGKLLSLATRGENLPVRDLHRSLDKQVRFKKRENLDSVLRELEAKGWLKLTKGSTGGRPTDLIALHPKSFELYREGDKRDKRVKSPQNAITKPFVLSSEAKNEGGQKGPKGGQKPPLTSEFEQMFEKDGSVPIEQLFRQPGAAAEVSRRVATEPTANQIHLAENEEAI